MPIDYVDGFDRYAASGDLAFTSRWVAALNTNNLATLVAGRFGARAIQLQSAINSGFIERLATSNLKYGMQCAFIANLADMSANNMGLARWLNSGGGTIATWGVSPAGEIFVLNGAGTQLFRSDGFRVPNNAWTYIEMHVEVSTTVGRIVLKINGEQIWEGTNLNLGSSPVHRIRFIMDEDGSQASFFHRYTIDDVITAYGESETPGESAALLLLPSADVSAQFTPSAGASNFATVDEQQANSDTDYNSSTTIGHEDVFDFTNITTTPDEVKAVFVSIAARKTDSATRQMELFFEIGGVDYTITTFFLGGSYQFFERVVETNPATSLPWTIGDINALRIGYRILQ